MIMCDDGHEEIVYDANYCPMCEADIQIDDLQEQVQELEGQVESLEEQIINNELEDSK